MPYSYEKFLSDLENFYRRIYSEDYQINHNKYSFEIGANLFSLDRTMKYLNRYYKEVWTNSKVLDMYNRKYEENISNDSSSTSNTSSPAATISNVSSSNGDASFVLNIFIIVIGILLILLAIAILIKLKR